MPVNGVNKCGNPSAETNANGWSLTIGTLARITTDAVFGTCCYQISGATTGWVMFGVSPLGVPQVAVGEQWTLSAHVKAPVGKQFILREAWNTAPDASGSQISNSSSSTFTGTGNWERVHVTATAPATAQSFLPSLRAIGTYDGSEIVKADGWQFEPGPLTEYRDGSLGPGYSWDGTPHASTSRYVTPVAGGVIITPGAYHGGILVIGETE